MRQTTSARRVVNFMLVLGTLAALWAAAGAPVNVGI
jgi:hypothetical protein